MSEMQGDGLPRHVADYLEDRKVDADDLPENVRVAFAGMSTREIDFLAFVGNELQQGRLDIEIIARIH